MADLTRLLGRIRSLLSEPAPADWLLGACFALAAELEVLVSVPGPSWQQELNAFTALAVLSLAWCRRQPLVPGILITAAPVLNVAAGAGVMLGFPQIALFVFTYALGAYASNRVLVLGEVLPSAGAMVMNGMLGGRAPFPIAGALSYYVLFVTGAPILIGRLVRSRATLVGRLEAQREALLAEGERRSIEALLMEQQRISRELHIVVVRSVNALLRDVALAEADRGPKGLTAVVRMEAVARRALREMRRLLDALGLQGEPPNYEPGDVAAALERVRTRVPPDPFGGSQHSNRLSSAPDPRRGSMAVWRALRQVPWPWILAGSILVYYEVSIQLSELHGPRLLNGLFGLVVVGPIAWSRTRPLAAAAVSLLAATAMSWFLTPLPIGGPTVPWSLYLFFSVAAFTNRRRALAGLALCAVGFTSVFGAQVANGIPLFVGAWVAGRLFADRSRLARELQDTNRRLTAERELRAHEVVVQERTRVARELHDVIGHTLTVVVLQAGAARRNWVTDRARAARALESLAGVAREGLTDLLASLDTLEEPARTQPSGLAITDIDALVEQARSAGVRVAFLLDGFPARVNPQLELTTYRVVQEALTNVMKHAPRSRAQVRIRSTAGSLQVEVTNSGPLLERAGAGGRLGQGLPGMAQRVAANGGELEWGRDSTGGFVVRASLPNQGGL